MPINCAKEFLKSVYCVSIFSWLFLKTLTNYFVLMRNFCKKNFGSNHYYYLVLKVVGCQKKSDNLRRTLRYRCQLSKVTLISLINVQVFLLVVFCTSALGGVGDTIISRVASILPPSI